MNIEDRKRKIYEKKLELFRQIKSLDRELARIDLGLPEPFKVERDYIPYFLRAQP